MYRHGAPRKTVSGVPRCPPPRTGANLAYQIGTTVSDHVKIPKAFDAFMADSGSNDKRDAIVIYRTPRDGTLPSASKDPTERSKYVKLRADRQRTVYVSIAEGYELEALRRLTRKIELTTSPVGSHVLPVAPVEVTSRTLPALAEQPDVVAILPNQRLHPIKPRVVDYRGVSSAESKAGLHPGASRHLAFGSCGRQPRVSRSTWRYSTLASYSATLPSVR